MSLDCQGMSKQEAFAALVLGLKKHQQNYLSNEVSARSMGRKYLWATTAIYSINRTATACDRQFG